MYFYLYIRVKIYEYFILVFRLFYTKTHIRIHESTTSVILSVSTRKIRIKRLTFCPKIMSFILNKIIGIWKEKYLWPVWTFLAMKILLGWLNGRNFLPVHTYRLFSFKIIGCWCTYHCASENKNLRPGGIFGRLFTSSIQCRV